MADTAAAASPTSGAPASVLAARSPESIDWDAADVNTITQTAGYKPFLAFLDSPAKLTPAQRQACGIDPGWGCSAGDKDKRRKCAQQQQAHMTQLREKCEQYAAIPPPPVLGVETTATNPQGDAASAALAQDLALQEWAALQQGGAPLDSSAYGAPTFGDFIPGVSVTRGPQPEPGPLAALGVVPWWAWAALAAGAVWWWSK